SGARPDRALEGENLMRIGAVTLIIPALIVLLVASCGVDGPPVPPNAAGPGQIGASFQIGVGRGV
ncbi:MAG: hypothetical protein Q4F71_10495, partial [Paracoccus sp. (in: a-proteobacteria)]|nr:hypothetical protein [Paracoccus sp. (in: a-proteobacteria)]